MKLIDAPRSRHFDGTGVVDGKTLLVSINDVVALFESYAALRSFRMHYRPMQGVRNRVASIVARFGLSALRVAPAESDQSSHDPCLDADFGTKIVESHRFLPMRRFCHCCTP